MRALLPAAVAVCCLLGCSSPGSDAGVDPAPGPLRSEKAITSFALASPPAVGVIDEASRSVRVELPAGSPDSALVAVFATSGQRVSVGGVEQVSGETPNDFSAPVEYVVTAEDGSQAGYTVTVAVALSDRKAITSFSIREPPAAGRIDDEARIIRVRLPPGTALQSLVAEYATTGVRVAVAGVEQQSGSTANDFTGEVRYVVSAEDGSAATWSVRVVGAIGLLVNELDVDQVGMDTAEYVELYATSDVDPVGLVLVFCNGGVTPGQEYARVDLAPLGGLGAGRSVVVGGPRVTVADGALEYSPPGWDASNRIQNGPGDAVTLYDTIGCRVVDTVSYAGVLHRAVLAGGAVEIDATEGATGAPADSNAAVGSISRFPDGVDTGHNGADFRFSPAPSPGAPNG